MKKSLICLTLIVFAIATYTFADDFKDWIIGKHKDGEPAIGIGAFNESPTVVDGFFIHMK